jgi:lipoyl(octanoyl) transferase
MKQSTYRILDYCNLGIIDYQEAWNLQLETLKSRSNNKINDTLFLLEHPNTYTLGKIADKNNLICSEEFLKNNNFSVYNIDRGGDITYHGPGQIVGYPIIDLKNWIQDTHKYLRNLEEVIIRTCSHFGLNSGRKEGLTGVWIDNRKICAIGIKVSRWITMHGFAFNINTNLSLFNGIIPCGISDKEVTSLQKELNYSININEVNNIIISKFATVFQYDKITEFKNHSKRTQFLSNIVGKDNLW